MFNCRDVCFELSIFTFVKYSDRQDKSTAGDREYNIIGRRFHLLQRSYRLLAKPSFIAPGCFKLVKRSWALRGGCIRRINETPLCFEGYYS